MAGFFALIVGFMFGVGLLVSGMTEPENILGFLDVWSDTWNPALLVVLMTAVVIYGIGYRSIVGRNNGRQRPWMEPSFHLPSNSALDPSLIMGAAIFGIGWGLAGFCPGPAVVAAAMGRLPALVFCGAMLVGMWAFRFSQRR